MPWVGRTWLSESRKRGLLTIGFWTKLSADDRARSLTMRFILQIFWTSFRWSALLSMWLARSLYSWNCCHGCRCGWSNTHSGKTRSCALQRCSTPVASHSITVHERPIARAEDSSLALAGEDVGSCVNNNMGIGPDTTIKTTIKIDELSPWKVLYMLLSMPRAATSLLMVTANFLAYNMTVSNIRSKLIRKSVS